MFAILIQIDFLRFGQGRWLRMADKNKKRKRKLPFAAKEKTMSASIPSFFYQSETKEDQAEFKSFEIANLQVKFPFVP